MLNDRNLPIEFDKTLPINLAAALRVGSVLVGGGVAVIGFLSTKDLVGLVNYIRSDDFMPVAGAALAAGSFAYGQYRTWRESRKARRLANVVPDSIAKAK